MFLIYPQPPPQGRGGGADLLNFDAFGAARGPMQQQGGAGRGRGSPMGAQQGPRPPYQQQQQPPPGGPGGWSSGF